MKTKNLPNFQKFKNSLFWHGLFYNCTHLVLGTAHLKRGVMSRYNSFYPSKEGDSPSHFHCSPFGILLLSSYCPSSFGSLSYCSIVLLFYCSIVLFPIMSSSIVPFLLFSPLRLFSIVLLIVCNVWALPYCSTYLLFCLGIYRDPCTVVLPSSNLLGFPLKG
jgi:hypothetical protein